MTHTPTDHQIREAEKATNWCVDYGRRNLAFRTYLSAFEGESVRGLVEAARDWKDITEEDCGHHPEWKALAEALRAFEEGTG